MNPKSFNSCFRQKFKTDYTKKRNWTKNEEPSEGLFVVKKNFMKTMDFQSM